MNHHKSLVSALAAVCMILTASLVRADQYSDNVQPTSEAMAGDLIFVRPLGLVATILGTATFLVALPFTIPSGSVGSSAQALIGDPASYTFKRPLGQSQAKPIQEVQR
ncbi:MAG TPA: hypothetical protein VIW72_07560 [Burkholderiales bacterium]